MGIQNFPAALQNVLQLNYLAREFKFSLESAMGFRAAADREPFPIGIGETLTKTRKGLKAPITAALSPANNTNLDNGLAPSGWTVEQYTMAINMYADTIDLNMVTSLVGIESQFMANVSTNGIQARQTLERLARNALFNAYMGGNSRVRTTLGSAGVTVAVDDIRGFQTAAVNGVQTVVSASNALNVTVGSNVYSLVAAVADGTNVSTAPNGISGTLTFATSVSVADGTAGNAVTASNAPTILRPNGRATTANLVGTDLLSMSLVLDAVAQLRNNAVPTINGLYNCYLDPTSARQIFADPDFKLLYQGATAESKAFKDGQVIEILSVRLVPVTEAFLQVLGPVKVHRPIIVGAGALVEGYFEGTATSDLLPKNSLVNMFDGGIAQVTREPLDRLQQIIAQSWYWIGGYCVPTDLTANQNIIPTASNAAFKRAVLLETGG